MKIRTKLISVSMIAAFSGLIQAAVTPEEAKQLGTTLTPTGAEKAGNSDGMIPAYTGGLTKSPAGFVAGSGQRPDPFAGEKPLFSIKPVDMDKYANKLTDGVKALMKKYQDFRMDVYPTHRTVSFPKYVIDNTLKNATTTKTSEGGLAVESAHGGVPFPMPKDGYEVMWNHLLRYEGLAFDYSYTNINVDKSGRPVVVVIAKQSIDKPYYDPKTPDTDIAQKRRITFTGPTRRAGEGTMAIEGMNNLFKPRITYQYLPGQRRVRLAPDLAYDTPNAGTAGVQTWDEAPIFAGSLDRFNWKLVGKKEIYIPYNAYKACYLSTGKEVATPNFVNPDVVRWELHRVWVVEATLREGKRHIYHKRRFYIDEDSWTAVAADEYDARGELYKTSYSLLTTSYDASAAFNSCSAYYDLVADIYALQGHMGPSGYLRYRAPLPDKDWTPDSLASAGIR